MLKCRTIFRPPCTICFLLTLSNLRLQLQETEQDYSSRAHCSIHPSTQRGTPEVFMLTSNNYASFPLDCATQ